MATLRLTFLYPNFFRSLRASDATGLVRPSKASKQQSSAPRNLFHTSSHRHQQSLVQRHGNAVEPPPPGVSSEVKSDPIKTPKEAAKGNGTDKKTSRGKKAAKSEAAEEAKTAAASTATDKEPSPPPESQLPETSSAARVEKDPATDQPRNPQASPDGGILSTVLHMGPPSSTPAEHQPPHLHAPPYIHHFDTYSLVRDLERGDFTDEQAVTIMKAIRNLLAVNLDVAKEGLVSKSDVENETYLFRGACSELRTEILNSRSSKSEKMRTERAQLQHEVDILNQKMTQESLTLKDELKGMFDDRKMAVRMEQRGMESSIQELNYKITVLLNSDMKSEVEGLRWVLTRRAAMAIGVMAFLILSSLRYTSYRLHTSTPPPSIHDSSHDSTSSSSSTSSSPSGGHHEQRPEMDMSSQARQNAGDVGRRALDRGDPSYLSLG
ncbi:MAG: hypothetical protein M1817_006636 [Caeruleum heppii]|nr:MAG: hypothetical protein M1817_006636 [Caeruleum heppii]